MFHMTGQNDWISLLHQPELYSVLTKKFYPNQSIADSTE